MAKSKKKEEIVEEVIEATDGLIVEKEVITGEDVGSVENILGLEDTGAGKIDDLAGLTEDGGEEAATPEVTKPTKQEIIRGRMPLIIVGMIKFADSAITDGALATKFRTTNGKVSDIRKGRNFGYVTEEFKPNADMKAKAVEYADQLDDKTVLEAVNATAEGTAEEITAFETTRKASRPGKKVVEAAPVVEGGDAAKAEVEDAGNEVEGADVTDSDLAGLTE